MNHSQETINKILAMHYGGFTSREIAKVVLGSESKKSTVNNAINKAKERRDTMRKSFDKAAQTFEESCESARLMHEDLKKIPGYKPAPKREDNSRILFISDLHIPFHHEDSFGFLQHLKQKYNPTRIICLGDELDKHSLSYHEHDPNGYSAGHELEVSLPFIQQLHKLFPKMDILESNHGSLVWRKAKTNGIPKQYIKSYNDVLGVDDGWQWHFDMTLDLPDGTQCYVHHGKSSDILKLSQSSGMSAVSGHFHERFKIDYWANSSGLYWGMSCGCLIDDDAYAFNYNNVNLKRPIIGTGLVIDSIPILEPMILLENGRWRGY